MKEIVVFLFVLFIQTQSLAALSSSTSKEGHICYLLSHDAVLEISQMQRQMVDLTKSMSRLQILLTERPLAPKCPVITAPQNGALVCGLTDDAKYCSVRCNAGFDHPHGVDTYMECSPTSRWQWQRHLYDCVEDYFPGIKMEYDQFYLSTNCEDMSPEEKQGIKKRFQDTLETNGIHPIKTIIACG